MTPTEKIKFVNALRKVLDDTCDSTQERPVFRVRIESHMGTYLNLGITHGICNVFQAAMGYPGDEDLEPLWSEWPLFSGDEKYPVPGDLYGVEDSRFAYNVSSPFQMWSPHHPYGAARRELAEFLIKKLSTPLPIEEAT